MSFTPGCRIGAFTPGPWRLNDKRNWNTLVLNQQGQPICAMAGVSVEADAPLIAAAPDLYLLLGRLAMMLDEREISRVQALELLAKIDGAQ